MLSKTCWIVGLVAPLGVLVDCVLVGLIFSASRSFAGNSLRQCDCWTRHWGDDSPGHLRRVFRHATSARLRVGIVGLYGQGNLLCAGDSLGVAFDLITGGPQAGQFAVERE